MLDAIRNELLEFIEYLEANDLELNENGEVVPKNKKLLLELDNEE